MQMNRSGRGALACVMVASAAVRGGMPIIAVYAGVAVLSAGLSVGVGGCEKKKVAPPPAPPPPPPPPPAPEPIKVDGLMQAMKADARVQFPAANAPTDERLARAVIELADALARGDAKKFESMIDAAGKGVLSELQASGAWEESTGKKIEAVRVAKLSSGGDLVLAVQEVGSAYPLAWKANTTGPAVVFSAVPTRNLILARASEFDMASLSVVSSAPAPSAAAKPGEEETLPGAAPKAEEPAAPEESGTPTRRRSTPNGPVNIPNPGGNSGGNSGERE